ncbi:hypothetical protein PbB2_00110 [Candidatus Phycosocius bacilliformis]|uniref:Uncharacterized protein n=1 Tax=Candidatus Phycosocius bacilliformis TaxID=1445552 RepID=A0A2P2E5X7_9PROT|nr:hypothetical protein [Candidatus Phycosocius bacilliformis]GBF56454.1 hypothetical protein PbB2_00110 [Candidatus Phycosocius bacilliformis]
MTNINITISSRFVSDRDYAAHAQAGYDLFESYTESEKTEVASYLDLVNSEDFNGDSHPLVRAIERAVFESITADWLIKPDGYNSPQIAIEAA